METFCDNDISAQRRCVLVLRHPHHLQRGIVLLTDTHEACRIAACSLIETLGTRGSQPLALDVYTTMANNSSWLREICSSPLSSQGAEHSAGNSANSAQPTSSASQVDTGSSASSTLTETGNHGECPICFEEIELMQAAMRCSGMGGQNHYFHKTCMQRWIQQCRDDGNRACCPMCRGTLEFNIQRLNEFLIDPSSANLSNEDRTFLQSIADRFHGTGDSWQDACTTENALYMGGLAAAAGWGFTLGYMNNMGIRGSGSLIQNVPPQHIMAEVVGLIAGTILRQMCNRK